MHTLMVLDQVVKFLLDFFERLLHPIKERQTGRIPQLMPVLIINNINKLISLSTDNYDYLFKKVKASPQPSLTSKVKNP